MSKWLALAASNLQRGRIGGLVGLVLFILVVYFANRLGSVTEYQSSLQLANLPLLAWGQQPHAWIALGAAPVGVLAIGGVSMGVIAIGGVAVGIVSLGGVSVGLLLAIGGFAMAYYTLGALSIGGYAFSGAGVAYGVYLAQGRQLEKLLGAGKSTPKNN